LNTGEFTAPRSGCAQQELSSNYSNYFFGATIVSILGPIAGIIIGLVLLITDGLAKAVVPFTCFIGISAVLWLASLLFRHSRWKKVRISILESNERDYRLSSQLSKALGRFSTALSTDFPTAEPYKDKTWKAFRVEHFVSDSIRGKVGGSIELTGFLFSFHGSFKGKMKGDAIPNLLDASTMIFLQNDQEETLRLIIPSPRAARALLTMIIEQFLDDFDPDYKYNASHVETVLNDFSMDDSRLIEPISHPDTIDLLDLTGSKPLAERPLVKVAGEQIQPGIVLATALEVNGQESQFLPTGLFKALTSDISKAIEIKSDQIQASVVLTQPTD